MKETLLATWFKSQNYGTVLQAYALYEILNDSRICKIEGDYIKSNAFLLNYKTCNPPKKFCQKIINNLSIKKILWKLSNRYVRFYYRKGMYKKQRLINDFIAKNINLYPKHTIDKDQLESLKNFDLYITGSDQIWNPNLLDEVYLLDWVKKGKKISYSSCICVNHIPDEMIDKYKKLSSFSKIMIRDNNDSKKQLSKLLNKDVITVIDPVLLIGKNIIKDEFFDEKSSNEKRYILSYILGNNIKSRKSFVEFGKSNKIDMKSIICVNDRNLYQDILLKKYAIWDVDPIDFIYKIKNCDLLFTDSFHAILLAVVLNKSFVIQKRESQGEQNNRIREFLKTIGLEYRCDFFPRNLNEAIISKEEWEKVNNKVNEIRQKSYNELMKGIK